MQNYFYNWTESASMYRHIGGFPGMLPQMPGSEGYSPFPGMQLPPIGSASFYGGNPVRGGAQGAQVPPVPESNIKMEQKEIQNYNHPYGFRENWE